MASIQTEGTRTVVTLMGGRKVFKRRIVDNDDLQTALRKGVPYDALVALTKAVDVPIGDLTALLGVAQRTLARRKHERRLSPTESDRLFRLAHITRLAMETLGSLDTARTWLQRDNRALDGNSPISVLDTEIGERRVEEILNRINYGIYG